MTISTKRNKFDIDGVVNTIIENIPTELFESSTTKFLDPACGGGQFLAGVIAKLQDAGHSAENIKSRVFGFETNRFAIRDAKFKLQNGATIEKRDFLNEDINMKDLIIVMNAPYQKQTWIKFLDKAISLEPKIIAQIAPDGTGNFSSRSNKLEQTYIDNGIQVYEDCTSSFPNVQSGKICYAILDRESAANPSCFQKNDIETIILNKIIGYSGTKVESKLSSKRSAASRKAPRFDNEQPNTVKALESVKKDSTIINYVDPKHTTIVDGTKYYFANRFFGKDATSPIVEINETIGISPNIIAIEKVPGVSLEQFKNMMLTDVKRFALKVLRAGAFDTSPRHLRQISLVDDGAFNLTQDEIDYIRENI